MSTRSRPEQQPDGSCAPAHLNDQVADALPQSKVVVVKPAYDAGRTLRMTYDDPPKESANLTILVDDGSKDATLEIPQEFVAQPEAARFRIDEIAVPVRYLAEASSASFLDSHLCGVRRPRRFQSLRGRYTQFLSHAGGAPRKQSFPRRPTNP
jgi:hypothetical protein